MPDRRSVDFAKYFAQSYPAETLRLVLLLVAAGTLEAVGLLTLLPILGLAVDISPEGAGPAQAVARVFSRVGLEPDLPALLLVLVGALACKSALRWVAMRRVGYTVARISADLRDRLVRALLHARWSYFPDQMSGRLANEAGGEAFRAALAYRQGCLALAGAVQVVVYAALVVSISWQVALVALLFGGAVAAALGALVRASRQAGGERSAATGALVGHLADAVQQVKAIKSLGVEGYFRALLERDTRQVRRAEERTVVSIETLHAVHEPLLAAALALGIYGVLSYGGFALPELLVLVFLFHRLSQRLHVVQIEYQAMATSESAFWSLHQAVREAEQAREERTGGLAPPPVREWIEFREVTFRYGESPVLEGVSFRIPAGGLTAVVGASGAGKTTIADLLLGLHEPQGGAVLVDGVPLSTIDPHAWRRLVGYVPQEPLLLHESVAANVAFGRAADRPTIEAALRSAGAWSFVTALPGGVDAPVGERGTRLSGGQRQRLALARALLGNPRVLVLDEATAALDAGAERDILETLEALRGEVTIVMISHRLALAERADLVLEVGGGAARVVPAA